MTARVRKALMLIGLVLFAFGLSLAFAQSQPDAFSRWRPTHKLAGVRYVGTNACTQCHAAQSASRLSNPISRALARVDSCEVLKTHRRLSFRHGAYNYKLVRSGNRTLYTIIDDVHS